MKVKIPLKSDSFPGQGLPSRELIFPALKINFSKRVFTKKEEHRLLSSFNRFFNVQTLIMKKITLFSILLAFSFSLDAQYHLPCLHDMAVEINEEKYPGYRQAADAVFENVKHSVSPRTGDIYTIPVVVHVVWKNPEENISDAQIQEQIDELNRCYRRENPDTVNLRSVFEDVVGDPGIEFYLHDIMRVETTNDFAPSLTGMPDEVKVTAQGGSDAFDTEQFLNIWVCKIQPLFGAAQVLGYAYPPVGLPGWPAGTNAPSPELEGVVIDYSAFGVGLDPISMPDQNGGTMIIPIEGRTAVHEVGHYLGLRHIWGTGITASFGIKDCSGDDGLDDTPNQGLPSNFQCDPTSNSCVDASNDRPDMIENFMDYSAENCMNSFTNGQIAIMRGVLEGPRSGLLNPLSSVDDVAADNALEVFPNPFNETVIVNFESDFAEGAFYLTDLLGKRILTGNVSGEQLNLNLSDLTDGVYNFSVQTEKGLVLTKRLVKK